MVKILEHNAGLLTNQEVLKVLYDRGADGLRPGSRALPAEKRVYSYLQARSGGMLEGKQVLALVKDLEALQLSRSELVQVLDLAPRSEVEVHLVVEECEARLGEEQITNLLDKVEKHLPAPVKEEDEEEQEQ